MTNGEIVNLYEGLQSIKTIALPIQVTYVFLRDNQVLSPLYQAIMQCRDDLVRKYGAPQEDGTYTVPQENIGQFQEEINQLANIENQVELTKVSLSELSSLNLSMSELQAIMPIISEGI